MAAASLDAAAVAERLHDGNTRLAALSALEAHAAVSIP